MGTTRSGTDGPEQQGRENELHSSQYLSLQRVCRELPDTATVPAGRGQVQRKKPIPVIEGMKRCRAIQDLTMLVSAADGRLTHTPSPHNILLRQLIGFL
jgi:hypothetical protein